MLDVIDTHAAGRSAFLRYRPYDEAREWDELSDGERNMYRRAGAADPVIAAGAPIRLWPAPTPPYGRSGPKPMWNRDTLDAMYADELQASGGSVTDTGGGFKAIQAPVPDHDGVHLLATNGDGLDEHANVGPWYIGIYQDESGKQVAEARGPDVPGRMHGGGCVVDARRFRGPVPVVRPLDREPWLQAASVSAGGLPPHQGRPGAATGSAGSRTAASPVLALASPRRPSASR